MSEVVVHTDEKKVPAGHAEVQFVQGDMPLALQLAPLVQAKGT